MHDGPIELNIGNICGGAVPELFEHEIGRIIKNIADVNTNPEEKRSLVLEFKFKPSPDRKSAVVSMQCKSKLAGVNPVAGSVFMSSAQGVIRAFTEDPRQVKLFEHQQTVTPQAQ